MLVYLGTFAAGLTLGSSIGYAYGRYQLRAAQYEIINNVAKSIADNIKAKYKDL